MDNSILFLNKGPHAASSRYRATLYKPLFEAAGWRYRELPCNDGLIARLKILRCARQFSWVVIQRKLFGPIFLRLLKLANANLVFDFDDAIFLKSSGQPSTKRRKSFARTAGAVKRVWAGNHYLARYAGEQNAAVDVIPTAINIEKYQPTHFENHADNSLTLIWIGSSSTQKYLKEFKDTFEAIGKAIPGLTLLVVADFDFALDNINVKNIRWSLESEQKCLNDADIGIAPMSDNPWTRGKCALKVLQYMAAGLPVVSSDSGANTEVILDGKTGYLGDTAESWINAINTLKDKNHRTELGGAGRQIVEQEFTTTKCFERMLDSLNRRG